MTPKTYLKLSEPERRAYMYSLLTGSRFGELVASDKATASAVYESELSEFASIDEDMFLMEFTKYAYELAREHPAEREHLIKSGMITAEELQLYLEV